MVRTRMCKTTEKRDTIVRDRMCEAPTRKRSQIDREARKNGER